MKYFYTYKAEDRFWVYDRYSNKIVEIDELTYKIFTTYDKHQFDEKKAVLCLNGTSDKKQVIQKVKDIKQYQNDYDMFKPLDIEKCVMPVFDKELKTKYENEVHHIIFNLTDDCNLRCKYCKFGGTYEGARTHSPKSMSYEVIDEGIKLIKKYYKNKETLIIAFYGGEPLMEFEKIKYIVQKIKSLYKDVNFTFTTNGILLSKKIFSFLVKHDFSLNISLDGSKKIHDSNRVTKTGKGTFDIISKRINGIKEIDINYFNRKIGFNVTIAPPYNLIELVDFLEGITNINQQVFLDFVDPYGTNYFDNFDMRIENEKLTIQFEQLMNEYIILKTKNIWNLRAKLLGDFFGSSLLELDDRYMYPLETSQISPNGTCFPGLTNLFITTKGKLGMCEKVNEEITFGNVKNGIDISEVKIIYNEYCNVINKVCLDCWAYRLCKSCYISSILNGRISVKRKMKDCKYKKRLIINDLEAYTRIKMYNADAFKTITNDK